jgi:UDP-GlcNAc:undecaprenyl-phosphate/decaprenyl-phosphate GlcNAc-1-phosphate transferase
MPRFVPFVIAALAAGLITPVMIRIARSLRITAPPRPDRWNQRPTALLGGTAIYGAAMIAAAVTLPHLARTGHPALPGLGALWAAATLVFAVGLLDDLYRLSPQAKLGGELLAAGLVTASGLHLAATPATWWVIPLTIFWIVGITNAVNLLDNMDGVAAGVIAVAALTVAMIGRSGPPEIAALSLCIAGACCGFLLYNFSPARIFMGDCGSLFLGFAISTLSLAATARAGQLWSVSLFSPAVILAIPIFDTTFVTISRWRGGRPIVQGGRDHTTHRLAILGLPEWGVACSLYLGSALLGGLAVASTRWLSSTILALGALLVLACCLFGAYLAKAAADRKQRGGEVPPDGQLGERHRPRSLV